MNSKHGFTATTPRLCGHVAPFAFTSGASNRVSDRLYAAATVCASCREKIRLIAHDAPKAFFKIELQPMKAKSLSQASFANSVRIKHLRLKGPIMAQLAQSDDDYAPAALAAYKLLFGITDARFWIDNKDANFDASWVTSEIEALIRPLPTTAVHPASYSAFHYWALVDLAPIKLARDSLPETKVIDDVPPAVFSAQPDTLPHEHSAQYP